MGFGLNSARFRPTNQLCGHTSKQTIGFYRTLIYVKENTTV